MRYLILGSAVIAIFTFAAREVAAQPRACVRADIGEGFVLPDGSAHPAGRLRICLERDYSPVAGLHTIAADGHANGRFLSRRVKPEVGNAEAPQLAFVRDASGVLVLRGYTLARNGEVEAYWLERPRDRRTVPAGVQMAQAPAAASDTVWLAAVVGR